MTSSLLKVKIKNWSIIPPFNAIFKSRRLYSSTVSQEPESLVGASNHVELVLPGLAIETPMVTKNELVKYFYPLFCRGWDIKCLSKADFEHFGDGVRNICLNN